MVSAQIVQDLFVKHLISYVYITLFFSISLLKSYDYVFRDRGQIEVKGKGLQHTYFLLGLKGKTLAEPDDNVRTLPMLHKDVQIATSIKIDQNVQTFNEKGENSVDNDQPKQTMEKQKVSSSACLIL